MVDRVLARDVLAARQRHVERRQAGHGARLRVRVAPGRAVGDKVLEVELENPLAYFDKLVAWYTYMPIREDFFLSRNGRYAADAEDLIFNGPFRLTRWVHSASLRFEKNPSYWNREAIKLDVIDLLLPGGRDCP